MVWVVLHRRGLRVRSNAICEDVGTAGRSEGAVWGAWGWRSAQGGGLGTVGVVNDFDQRVQELPVDSAALEANLSRQERALVEVPALDGPARQALAALAAARAVRVIAVSQLYLDPHAYQVTARWSLEHGRPVLEADSTTDTVVVPFASAHILRLAVDGVMDEGAPPVDQALWPVLGSWALAVDHILDAVA